ncbi:hypothetical protein [Moorena sp. SIO3H5]|uniref:hypothetical protein n=1 Tax=Moorena sp. SIO3H5 TaxID=2607834 RepID=UPI0013BCC483|nr:hypothetical protein [Moorena sp. SIO3H5]NEO70322.1 hypothetical protein [Moorena sp. SIO3H5]
MSSSAERSSGNLSPLSSSTIIYGGIAWAIISLLFFLLFGITSPGQESPFWYVISTYFLECIPFLVASILCFRNWRSPQIASGRNVWLGLALGNLFYLMGGLIFGVWELYFNLNPDVSLADVFYLSSYVCLGVGMFLAVIPRRLNLELWQGLTIIAIAIVGMALAALLLFAPSFQSSTPESPDLTIAYSISDSTTPLVVKENNGIVISAIKSSQITKSEANQSTNHNSPRWAIELDKSLSAYSNQLTTLYIGCDVILLIIASSLLLAFWGGRFSQSWQMIAAATFCLYIADMWFKYAETRPNYQSGGLPEVFFVFSGVLFAIGAALEYQISSRSRRGSRRRAEKVA